MSKKWKKRWTKDLYAELLEYRQRYLVLAHLHTQLEAELEQVRAEHERLKAESPPR